MRRRKTIVVFYGGLGNQLFQYAYWCQLRQKGYSLLYLDDCRGHNGLVIHKYFDEEMLPCSRISVFIFRILKNMYLHKKVMRIVYRFISDRYEFNPARLFQYSDWQDARFISKDLTLPFNLQSIGLRNRVVLDEIMSSNSVSIHLRRGDYLTIPAYMDICNKSYYEAAIEHIRQLVTNPVFFVFSDDMEWCRENLKIDGAKYIDWNEGEGSIFDFILMTRCSCSITANSTFSFWGALIGRIKEVVVYPRVWNSITGRVPNFYEAFDHTTKLIPLDFSK